MQMAPPEGGAEGPEGLEAQAVLQGGPVSLRQGSRRGSHVVGQLGGYEVGVGVLHMSQRPSQWVPTS